MSEDKKSIFSEIKKKSQTIELGKGIGRVRLKTEAQVDKFWEAFWILFPSNLNAYEELLADRLVRDGMSPDEAMKQVDYAITTGQQRIDDKELELIPRDWIDEIEHELTLITALEALKRTKAERHEDD